VRDPSTFSPPNDQEELLPEWITPALLDETKTVWQTEFGEDLTTADAVGLLQNVGGVFEILYGTYEEKEDSND
jgi:hypothetical protein